MDSNAQSSASNSSVRQPASPQQNKNTGSPRKVLSPSYQRHATRIASPPFVRESQIQRIQNPSEYFTNNNNTEQQRQTSKSPFPASQASESDDESGDVTVGAHIFRFSQRLKKERTSQPSSPSSESSQQAKIGGASSKSLFSDATDERKQPSEPTVVGDSNDAGSRGSFNDRIQNILANREQRIGESDVGSAARDASTAASPPPLSQPLDLPQNIEREAPTSSNNGLVQRQDNPLGNTNTAVLVPDMSETNERVRQILEKRKLRQRMGNEERTDRIDRLALISFPKREAPKPPIRTESVNIDLTPATPSVVDTPLFDSQQAEVFSAPVENQKQEPEKTVEIVQQVVEQPVSIVQPEREQQPVQPQQQQPMYTPADVVALVAQRAVREQNRKSPVDDKLRAALSRIKNYSQNSFDSTTQAEEPVVQVEVRQQSVQEEDPTPRTPQYNRSSLDTAARPIPIVVSDSEDEDEPAETNLAASVGASPETKQVSTPRRQLLPSYGSDSGSSQRTSSSLADSSAAYYVQVPSRNAPSPPRITEEDVIARLRVNPTPDSSRIRAPRTPAPFIDLTPTTVPIIAPPMPAVQQQFEPQPEPRVQKPEQPRYVEPRLYTRPTDLQSDSTQYSNNNSLSFAQPVSSYVEEKRQTVAAAAPESKPKARKGTAFISEKLFTEVADMVSQVNRQIDEVDADSISSMFIKQLSPKPHGPRKPSVEFQRQVDFASQRSVPPSPASSVIVTPQPVQEPIPSPAVSKMLSRVALQFDKPERERKAQPQPQLQPIVTVATPSSATRSWPIVTHTPSVGNRSFVQQPVKRNWRMPDRRRELFRAANLLNKDLLDLLTSGSTIEKRFSDKQRYDDITEAHDDVQTHSLHGTQPGAAPSPATPVANAFSRWNQVRLAVFTSAAFNDTTSANQARSTRSSLGDGNGGLFYTSQNMLNGVRKQPSEDQTEMTAPSYDFKESSSKKSLLSLYEQQDLSIPIPGTGQTRPAARHCIAGNFMQCLEQQQLFSSLLISSFDAIRTHATTEGEQFFKNTPQGKSHMRYFVLNLSKKALQWGVKKGLRSAGRDGRTLPLQNIQRILLFEAPANEVKRFKFETTSPSCSILVVQSAQRTIELLSERPLPAVSQFVTVLASCCHEAQLEQQRNKPSN